MPGMRIAETITNRFMATVVNEDAVLSDQIIGKLKNLNYQKLRVYAEADKETEKNHIEQLNDEYTENKLAMKSVLHDISAGKKIDMPTIAKVSTSVYERRTDFLGVLSCLNQVRDSDEYTYSHCLNVAFICLFISKWLNFNKEETNAILQAGLLHDVGKCKIPHDILNKPSSLTEEEFEYMKKHTVFGYRLLDGRIGVKPSTALAALEHHEKMNGKGYPLGINSDKIHLYGRITAIADIYDAMTQNRVYHKRATPFQAFQILEDHSFAGNLDPEIVILFIRNLSGYYVGDRVKISDGREGFVAFINPRSISRPIVQTESEIINLEDEKNYKLQVSEML